MEQNLLTMRPKSGRSLDKTVSAKSQERRVAAYLRVSTEEQAENPEGSIKNQEERIKMALALRNTDGRFGSLEAVYCDAGRSGKDMKRPELQRLLKAIASGEINMVMVRNSRVLRDRSRTSLKSGSSCRHTVAPFLVCGRTSIRPQLQEK